MYICLYVPCLHCHSEQNFTQTSSHMERLFRNYTPQLFGFSYLLSSCEGGDTFSVCVCVWFNVRCLDAGVRQVVYQIVGPILVISVQVGRLYLLRCLLVQRHKSIHV